MTFRFFRIIPMEATHLIIRTARSVCSGCDGGWGALQHNGVGMRIEAKSSDVEGAARFLSHPPGKLHVRS